MGSGGEKKTGCMTEGGGEPGGKGGGVHLKCGWKGMDRKSIGKGTSISRERWKIGINQSSGEGGDVGQFE